jgi:hypothetical protein
MKKCPWCAIDVPDDARICPYCWSEQLPVYAPPNELLLALADRYYRHILRDLNITNLANAVRSEVRDKTLTVAIGCHTCRHEFAKSSQCIGCCVENNYDAWENIVERKASLEELRPCPECGGIWKGKICHDSNCSQQEVVNP